MAGCWGEETRSSCGLRLNRLSPLDHRRRTTEVSAIVRRLFLGLSESHEVNSHHDQFEAQISSNFEAGQEITERIMTSVGSAGFHSREQFGIRLAVDEAVTNAIKHGNQFHPKKTVRVDFRLDQRGVRIEIEDQGMGFRLEEVPDPTADENLERPSGRGLMLMREFMTRIEFNAKGNRVVLEKHH